MLFSVNVNRFEAKLTEPLHWRMPCRVFVNSMSDLFHEALSDEAIDRVFAVMALCPQHEFYVLTKRAERMAQYVKLGIDLKGTPAQRVATEAFRLSPARVHMQWPDVWPLANVRLGVSVEDQQRADERLPCLMAVAALGWKTFVSAEPLLSEVDLRTWLEGSPQEERRILGSAEPRPGWIVIGGESGPGARPCDVVWIRSLVTQARASGVRVFMKQVGSQPTGWWSNSLGPRFNRDAIKHPRGGDPAEWPADLRLRQWPR